MNISPIESRNLRLVLQSPEDVRAQIAAMTPSEKAELSADWLARFEGASAPNPWVHGYTLVRRSDGAVVGQCGFKGPPTESGVVEIAYGVDTEQQGKGYATEAADALTAYAFGHPDVLIVRAHTLPEESASTRVLRKCGFERVGEVEDPEDGTVWRWQKERR